ncbi:hypothetical protein ACQ5SK_26995 [Bradyrhizobium japonicum]
MIDFKGHSTLGEWYITALSAMIGMDAAQRQILNKQPVDPSAIAHLQKILGLRRRVLSQPGTPQQYRLLRARICPRAGPRLHRLFGNDLLWVA